MREIREGELRLRFPEKGVTIERFDGPEHGLSNRMMKAVDFILEDDTDCYFLEIKDPLHSRTTQRERHRFSRKVQEGELWKDLVQKFRDTFLYRYAEGKVDKPVTYLLLIAVQDTALLPPLADKLRKNLPVGKPSPRWKRALVKTCILLTPERWKKHFSARKWTVERTTRTDTP